MRVLKVLHVIPSVSPLRGGPSVMVRQLTRSLASSGVETHIATTDDNGPEKLHVKYGEPFLQDGVTYWYFPRQIRFYTFSWPLSVWLSKHVSEFDLVHIHSLFSFAALPASYWAKRHGIPYVVRPLGTLERWGMTRRRPWLKRASFRILESRILKHATLIHYTSDKERREAETLGVRGAFAVIPNPVPDSQHVRSEGAFRSGHPELQGRRIVLFLSRLDEKKGLHLLLQGFASVRRRVPEASLVIVGDGPRHFIRELKSAAESLGISADVIWTGFLAGEQKQAALAAADVFALPSYSENFGIAVAEAMAAGVPVVVSDQVGIHREIGEARAGLVVPCDPTEIADALVTLLSDPALRKVLGDNGHALVSQRYSPDAVMRQVLAVYDRVA